MIDIFRPQSHDFIHGAGILGQIAHYGLSVDENQRMTRLGTADRHTGPPHGIDGLRNAGLVENDVFHRFSLLFFNFLSRNDLNLLGLPLGIFLGLRRLDDDLLRRYGLTAVCCGCRHRQRSRQP